MRILRIVGDKFEEFIMMLGMIAMVTLNFTNVVFRYLFPQTPFSYTEELTLLIFIWVTMLGIACGYKWISHTGLSIVTDILPRVLKRLVLVFATVCSVGLFVMIFYQGILMVQNQLKFGQILPGMKISAATAGAAIPACSVIVILRALQAGIREIKATYSERGAE